MQMKRVFIFNIDNNQDEYAKCLQFMEDVRNLEYIPTSDVCWIECEAEYDMYKVACEIEEKYPLHISEEKLINDHDLLWYFRIKIDEDDDIVNLMHYYLIKQKYNNVLAVLITPDFIYDMKISAYLSFELKKDRNTIFIKTLPENIDTFGMVHRLPGSNKSKEKKNIRLTKFLPLIEVTEETYNFLSSTVDKAQKDLDSRISKTNYLWEKTVMDTCTRLFTEYNTATSEKFMSNNEYIDTVRNITVLTYILFCAFRNHCSDRRSEFEIHKIQQELSDARDISEGILQILENIILHSQNGMGYFSFRIHDKNKSVYLNKNYQEYFSNIKINFSNSYLEMFIADCYLTHGEKSDESILCRQFNYNLKERSRYDAAVRPFIQKYRDLEVRNFFENSVWKEYNAVSDNIIEHYGLQLFDKIVSSCNGGFEVISTADYKSLEKQRYCSVKKNKERYQYVIPGTQYRVLIPIAEKSYEQEYAGMDFYDYPKTAMLRPIVDKIVSKDVNLAKIIKELNNDIKKRIGKRNQKKILKTALIQELSEIIYEKLNEGTNNTPPYVIHFILDEIVGAGLIEIIFKAYMKALIKLRTIIGNEIKVYTAFGKLSKEFIMEFCYLIGIYYYKAEESKIMMNTELYFWSRKYYEDLLISGINLYAVHNAVMERAALRGIYPQWLSFIDYVWQKYDCYAIHNENESTQTLPYDVIVKDEKKTIFDNIVEKVLQRPLADHELGCLIDNTHIQLTSKVHVSRFYNGHVLFFNNYFTNYFSYLIVKRISAYLNDKEDTMQNIVLVGYESYSEMLLVETSELLKEYIANIGAGDSFRVLPYIVGEFSEKKSKLRNTNGYYDKEDVNDWQLYLDSLFVFIVPISSTMSTFEKMILGLENNFDIAINSQNILANFALIVSRDFYDKENTTENINCFMTDIEKKYWKKKNEQTIITRDRELIIDYFIEVYGEWAEASRCKYCFPENSIWEKPLIKTDITGLAPLAQLGQKKKWIKGNNISHENISRINSLSNVLTYNHIERGGNHYLYYFDTVNFFYQNQSQIDNWLSDINVSGGQDKRCYNFIVSPLHSTNAGFTEEVNRVLFSNTAHIIRLDFCKTYRSNFMQQFSYLKILYQNIEKSSFRYGTETEINFYFVDDEVVSGKTLIRAKSLIKGLFEHFEKVDYIKVNVFKKIFLLINRLSDASKLNYIANIEDYESFVNFNISTIQNHDGFCFMCKLVDRANRYKYMSATNKMDAAWGEIEDKFKVKNYIQAQQKKEYKQDKYKNRMLAAHYSEAAMWKLSEDAAPGEYFQIILTKLFFNRLHKTNGIINLSPQNQVKFISFIKTLSRPFFVYRNNAKEAALHLLISFSESFLGMQFDDLMDGLSKVSSLKNWMAEKELYSLWRFLNEWGKKKDDSTYNLLLDLMEQLADMESAYLIRSENIIKIFKFYNLIADRKYGKDDGPINDDKKFQEKIQAKRDFELSYALFIKQITNEDADETKSLWIEYLFNYGEELNFKCDYKSNNFNDFCGYDTAFGRNILVENTKIIYDGIKYLAEKINDKEWEKYQISILEQNGALEDIESEIKNRIRNVCEKALDTQLESFRQVLLYYGLEQDFEKICLEVLLYGLMFNINTEGIPFDIFYKKFYCLIRDITRAEVQILMIADKNDIDEELFYYNTPCIIYDSRTELNINREIKLKDQALVDSEQLRKIFYELETYFISEDKKQIIIKYSINLKHKDKKDSIYLILQYSVPQEIKKLLFDIRFVLLCRSRTITRMKRDFNNNLFQSLWQTKRHNTLLEHFKNAAHEEGDVTRKAIDYIRIIDEYRNKHGKEKEIELRIYKFVLLKTLADNNISSIYHEILAQRLIIEIVYPIRFSYKDILSDIGDIRYILSNEIMDIEMWQKGECDLPAIQIDENIFTSSLYYIAPNNYRSLLLVISLIQNAYKHGNNKKAVHIYKESGIQLGTNKLDYLCITNSIDMDMVEITMQRIEEHISKPALSRKTQDKNKKNEGITLFSLNRYCQTIIAGLIQNSNDNKLTECEITNDNLIKYEIIEDNIIIKVPILKGD